MDAALKYLKTIQFSNLYNWSVQYLLENQFSYNKKFPLIEIGSFLKRNKTPIDIESEVSYKRVTIKVNNGGVFLRDIEIGDKIGTKKQFLIRKGQFLVSKIDARNGAFGVVNDEVDNAIITGNFWAFDVDYGKINPHYLALITTTPEFVAFCNNSSTGTTNRHYLQEDLFLQVQIPLPPLNDKDAISKNLPIEITQEKLVQDYNKRIHESRIAEEKAITFEKDIENFLLNSLGIKRINNSINSKGLSFIKFKDIEEWGFGREKTQNILKSTIYPNKQLKEIAIINPSTSFSKFDSNHEASFIPMVNISDIDGEVKVYDAGKVELSKGYTKFMDGDLLWARITPCMENGKSAIVSNMVNGVGYGSTEYHVIRTQNATLTKYIHLLLRYNKVLEAAKTYFTGSAGQQRVPKSFLENLSVPVPDERVQQEIVNKIKDLREQIKFQNKLALDLKHKAIKDFEKVIFSI